VRPPYNFDGEAELDVLPPPTLDEHGEEIRAEIARKQGRLTQKQMGEAVT
jgi:hypothetical protein